MMEKRRDYHTRQKDAILDILRQCRDRHVTVGDIAEALRQKGSPVGMTTVYRHIDRLQSEGLVQKYVLEGGGGAVYQYIGDDCGCLNHFHLKCETCGELIHLECPEMRAIYRHVLEDHGFQINSPKTVFYGRCADCRTGGEDRTHGAD